MMRSSELLKHFFSDSRIARIAERAPTGNPARFHLMGLTGSSRAFAGAAVFHAGQGAELFLLQDKESAAYFYNDLEQILEDADQKPETKRVLFFPSSFKRDPRSGIKDNTGLLSRTEVLDRLFSPARKYIIVSYPEAIAEKVVNRKFFEKHTLRLHTGEEVTLDFVLELLVEYEFERTDFVIEPGQFSLRGGLIDVYSFSGENPYRIEFIGDKVGSIRSFDPATQLSIEKKEEITIVPDIRINPEKRIDYASILTFLSAGTQIWIDDLHYVTDILDKQEEDELLTGSEDLLHMLQEFPVIEFGNQPWFPGSEEIVFHTLPQPSFNKNFELLIANFRKNTEEGYTNVILTDNPKQSERLASIIEDITVKRGDTEAVIYETLPFQIYEGFIARDLKLALYTDHQLFERYHRFRLRDGFAGKEAIGLKELYDLKPGDYVTHIDHGIGRFDGLEKIVNNGKEQEAIRLIYKNRDVLYVSIHSLHRISKYVGKEGTEPVLHRLGSDTWNKLKNKTKSKVKDIAKDLIRLYASRKATTGHACAPDTYLQTELEASFIYEDTPDQVKATADVKHDMEAVFPMDRLICGDVGFGKTEIAIRAAFKMVSESRQVAVLVPTTILALQHYQTFSERLKEFPCKVNYLNRFKSPKAQKKILEELEAGTLDIIIGTHRLLSKDVKFKNLGLLIIDEEQKFGVAAKEKIRQIKVNVDTLTLTATPIPRTLQFSMMGARDLSIINTPPPNRYPVQTEIFPFNEEIIQESIQQEVSRGGQVFFVNTRVQNILEVAGMVKRLVPRARVAVAHGQMEGPKLERIMADFIEGDFDVLIATTIIESGLDIPNVNTIIINDAHHYGLSDLHQLRGRVGRSNKKAFCYLLAPPPSALSEEARKRLQAIEEFAELGSGFNIAMRDLDIRGAGNLLGGEQSGFISEIGFEMYQKILDEAIQELKEQEFSDVFPEEKTKEFSHDCVIETDLEILIPDHYISNITERLSLYKELDGIETEDALADFRMRLIDRFGPVPEETEALFATIRLRWLARKIGFEKLVLKNQRLSAYFISNPQSLFFQSEQFNKTLRYLQEHPSFARMKEDRDKLTLSIRNIDSVEAASESLKNLLF